MAKKPEYRMQTLLDIRQRAKDVAEKALGEAIAAHKAEVEKQQQLELELKRMVAMREQRKREYSEKAMRGEMSAQDVVNANGYIKRLREQEDAQKNAIRTQIEIVAQKQQELDVARQALVKATQELKALEKHKEKFLEQCKKEAEAKEEEVMDELAQQIFLGTR